MNKVLIIGSGPAGITAGIYLLRAKIDNIIVTNNLGSLKKANKIENYYGFANPISGEELWQNGITQYINLGGNIIEDEIVSLNFEKKLIAKGLKQDYESDAIILATGVSRLLPQIKGVNDEIGISYCAICDAFFYKNKNVIILGNNKYAVSEAEILNKVAKTVTIFTNGREMLCETSFDINKELITEIRKNDNDYAIYLQNNQVLNTDGIFIAEGVAGAAALAKKIGAKINENNIIVDDKMKTNIPNLYAVGDCTGGVLQIVKASYQGMVAALDIIKENKKS